ncbi:predicted protein [Plenodomus lingam JN3]|uniref:Predicted protein n=1 Tax=Leptosphaeria maculans (strain JN3 / isolate v23.1.3 / race Av1-4-5-6-7-8) TaxID=985895 RepID=E4ZYG9_LEPMJ|nr:predicted protein [Plenodomus lingam JN3]CBX96495.1 predicted protein [Plenodomus lingam JN3]
MQAPFLHILLLSLSLTSTTFAAPKPSLLPLFTPNPNPQPRSLHPRPFPSESPSTTQLCTFSLHHRHHAPSPSTSYILPPILTDHANALTIDIALLRPREAYHSFVRVSETREFRIAGLLGGQNLTIRGTEDGGLVFGVDGGALSRRLSWRSDGLDGEREEEGKGEGREAWCVSGEWSVGTTGMSRVSLILFSPPPFSSGWQLDGRRKRREVSTELESHTNTPISLTSGTKTPLCFSLREDLRQGRRGG